MSRQGGDPLALGEAWGRLAMWYHAYGNYSRARLAYENGAALAPSDPRWPYLLGQLAGRDGDVAGAERLWHRTLELAPGHLATTVRLAELLLASGRVDEAASKFRDAVAQQPACARARAGLAEILLREGETDAAVEELHRALADQPDATSLHYRLAVALEQLGRSAEAATQLGLIPASTRQNVPLRMHDPWTTDVANLDLSARAFLQRGTQLLGQGRSAAAVRSFRSAIEEQPTDLEPRLNLALALGHLGRHREAQTELEEALEIDPSSTAVRHSLAMALARVGRTSDAESRLSEVLEKDPRHKLALHNLAHIHLRSSRLESAERLFSRALEIDPAMSSAVHGRAVALWLLDRERESLQLLDGALVAETLDPALVSLAGRLVVSAESLSPRDTAPAQTALDRLAGARQSVSLAETRALMLAASGHFRQAVLWQRAALDALERSGLSQPAARTRLRLAAYRAGAMPDSVWAPDEVYIDVRVTAPAT